MSYFALIREAGPGWQPHKALREQPGWIEHAAYMDGLAEDGFVVFGGPLSGSDRDRVRTLLIVLAADDEAVHQRLADDPWTTNKRLTTASIESWRVLLGKERIQAVTKWGD